MSSALFRARACRALLPLTACVLMAGCATTQQTQAPTVEAPVEAPAPEATTTREVADDVVAALESRDFERVAGRLDPEVAAMTANDFQEVWDSLVEQLGELQSWNHLGEEESEGRTAHLYRLTFEQLEVDALVGIAQETLMVQGLFFRPVAAEGVSAPYVDPTAFSSREVEVGEGELALSGTLTVPNGEGPFPGVILLHGSGPLDRDSNVGANRPFRDIAEGLSSRGVAVLRFDKRTFQHPDRMPPEVTLENEVILDGVEALKVLAAQPEVDNARRFVLGHSLGALVAPEVAKRDGQTAGVAILAPPGRKPWELVLGQLQYLQLPPEQLQAVETEAKRLADGSMPDEEAFLGAPASYWRDWANHDGIRTARGLRVPLLILRGERDYQVTAEDTAAWQRGLRGRARVEIETVPALNHLFIAGEGPSTPAEYGEPGHVDLGVIERLTRFMGAGSND